MSRCFPFPPPGYEKKSRPDDVSLIIKEKQKEKDHKKDKDEKERRERKEKERSVGKHKEKKGRKEKKHQDGKDKKKHKDKHGTSEEKKVGYLEHQDGEKLGWSGEQGNLIQDSKVFVKLQKRVENDSGATDSQMVQEIILTNQRSAKLPSKMEERSGGIVAEADNYMKDERDYARMVNGESLKINAMGLENGVVRNFSGESKKKAEGGARGVEKVEKQEKGKEKNKHESSDGKRDEHKHRDRDKSRKSKDKVGENGKEKEKGQGQERSKEQRKHSNSLDVHNRPPNFIRESLGNQGNLGKRKEPESNGFSCNNGIQLNKLPRPISSSHHVMQNGVRINPSQNIVNLTVEKQGLFQNHTVKTKVLPSQSIVENEKKSELGQTANNLSTQQQGATSNHVINNILVSSHPVVGNGRKAEPCQTASKIGKLQQGVVNNREADDKVLSSPLTAESGRRLKLDQPKFRKGVERQGVVIDHKMDKKESRVNDMVDPKHYTALNAPSPSVKVKENTAKPPHLDSKYLTQILTVPNVEWPQFDDQEWLFSSENSRAKRPKFSSPQIEGTKQVWAEAIEVESADVIALPYVIPY